MVAAEEADGSTSNDTRRRQGLDNFVPSPAGHFHASPRSREPQSAAIKDSSSGNNLFLLAAASSHHSPASSDMATSLLAAPGAPPLYDAMTPSSAFPEIGNLLSTPRSNLERPPPPPPWISAPDSGASRRSQPQGSSVWPQAASSEHPASSPLHSASGSEGSSRGGEGDASEEDDGEDDDDDEDDDEDLAAEEQPIDWSSIDADTFFQNFLSGPGTDWASVAAKTQAPRSKDKSAQQRKQELPSSNLGSTSISFGQNSPQVTAESPSQAQAQRTSLAYATSPYSLAGTPAQTPAPNYGSAIDLLTTVLGSGQEVPSEILSLILSSIAPTLGYQVTSPIVADSAPGADVASGGVDSLVPILRELIEKQQRHQQSRQQSGHLASTREPSQLLDISDSKAPKEDQWHGTSVPLALTTPAEEDEDDDEVNDPSYDPQLGDEWLAAAAETFRKAMSQTGPSPAHALNEQVATIDDFVHSPLVTDDRVTAVEKQTSPNVNLADRSVLVATPTIHQPGTDTTTASKAKHDTLPHGGDSGRGKGRSSVTRPSRQGQDEAQNSTSTPSADMAVATSDRQNPVRQGSERSSPINMRSVRSNRGRKPLYADDASRKAARAEANRAYQREWRQRRKKEMEEVKNTSQEEESTKSDSRRAKSTTRPQNYGGQVARSTKGKSTAESGSSTRGEITAAEGDGVSMGARRGADLINMENRLLREEVERLRQENIELRVEMEMMAVNGPNKRRRRLHSPDQYRRKALRRYETLAGGSSRDRSSEHDARGAQGDQYRGRRRLMEYSEYHSDDDNDQYTQTDRYTTDEGSDEGRQRSGPQRSYTLCDEDVDGFSETESKSPGSDTTERQRSTMQQPRKSIHLSQRRRYR